MKILNRCLAVGLIASLTACHHDDAVNPLPTPTPPATGDSLILNLGMNGNVNDASSEQNNGTLFGTSHYAAGRQGTANSAIELRAADANRIEVSDTVYNDLNRYTIYAEFMPYDSNSMTLIGRTMYAQAPDMHQGFSLMLNFPTLATGTRFATKAAGQCDNVNTTTAFAQPFLGATRPVVNAWNWVAVTFDGANFKMYLNDQLVSSGTAPGTTLCHGAPLQIGSWWQGEPHFFNGRIDQLRIYKGVLNATQLHNLYQ